MSEITWIDPSPDNLHQIIGTIPSFWPCGHDMEAPTRKVVEGFNEDGVKISEVLYIPPICGECDPGDATVDECRL